MVWPILIYGAIILYLALDPANPGRALINLEVWIILVLFWIVRVTGSH